MNILLLIDVVFQQCQNVLLEWERCNILDEFQEVPSTFAKTNWKFCFQLFGELQGKATREASQGAAFKNNNIRRMSNKGREA